MNSSSLQDEMLKSYIESVFNKYDTDKNGALDIQEMTLFFNDLFRNLGINTVVTEAQSLEAIKSIDENSDGMVDRQELFKAFKLMLNPYSCKHVGHNVTILLPAKATIIRTETTLTAIRGAMGTTREQETRVMGTTRAITPTKPIIKALTKEGTIRVTLQIIKDT